MPEEITPTPENQETPAPETEAVPEVETPPEPQPVVNYEERYNNLLPEFTRKSQRLSELESLEESLKDPEKAAEILGKYGYDLEGGGDPNDLYADPVEELRAEIDTLRSERAEERKQAEARTQAEEQVALINREITLLEQEFGEEFSDEEIQWLGERSERLRNEEGQPDVRKAYDQFNKLLEGRKSKWVTGKRSTRPAGGPGAAKVPDLDDKQTRQEWIDAQMAGVED